MQDLKGKHSSVDPGSKDGKTGVCRNDLFIYFALTTAVFSMKELPSVSLMMELWVCTGHLPHRLKCHCCLALVHFYLNLFEISVGYVALGENFDLVEFSITLLRYK